MQNYSPINRTLPLEEILAHRSHIILTWPEYYEKAIENFTAKAKLVSLYINHKFWWQDWFHFIHCRIQASSLPRPMASWESTLWVEVTDRHLPYNKCCEDWILLGRVVFFPKAQETVIIMSSKLRIWNAWFTSSIQFMLEIPFQQCYMFDQKFSIC